MISNEVTGSVRYFTNIRCVKWTMLNAFASQWMTFCVHSNTKHPRVSCLWCLVYWRNLYL